MAYNYNPYPGSRYNDLYAKFPTPDWNPVDQYGPGLDPAHPRPPLSPAPAPAPKAAIPQQQQQPTTVTQAPELAGLKHSSEAPQTAAVQPPAVDATAQQGTAQQAAQLPDYLQPLIDAISGLTKPVETPLGMDPAARQAMLDQYTRASQRGTNLAAEQLRERMGAATGGLVRPGESGLADTALGNIYRGGAGDIAQYAGQLAGQEAMSAPERALALQNLNLSRMGLGGQMGLGLAGHGLDREQFGYGQEMDALRWLMSLYGQEQAAQESAWAPYYQGTVRAYGG